LLIGICALPVLAGPNSGGTIFAHDANIDYTTDTAAYCGVGTAPTDCASADANVEGSTADAPKVWKVYAAFEAGTQPRLKGMTFGVQYDADELIISAYGPCIGDPNNGAAEFPGAGWPGNDTGTSLVWQDTQVTEIVEAYWFGGYSYYGNPNVFQLRDHPDPILAGNFADDSVPAIQDPISGYGSIGFDSNGSTVCPTGVGACCSLVDGTCTVLARADCELLENHLFSGDPSCDSDPCPIEAPCCIVTQQGTCEMKDPNV
jgi:hypothetical protein